MTPNHNSNTDHPHTSNPYGITLSLLVPLAAVATLRKRKQWYNGPWHMLVLVLAMGVSLTLVSCGPGGGNDASQYRVGNISGVPLIPLESWVSGGGTGIDWDKHQLCTEENVDRFDSCILVYSNRKIAYNTVVLHHGEDEGELDPYDGKTYFNAVLNWHLVAPNLDNFTVGYHFGIDANGGVYEGRPIGIRGSHVNPYNLPADNPYNLPEGTRLGNTGRLGVLLFGDFHVGEGEPTHNQIDSTVNLINGLKQDGYQFVFLAGHRQVDNSSECPGDNFIEGNYLEDIANRTGLRLINVTGA